MPLDNDLDRTSLVCHSPSPPGRISRAAGALALAALLVLMLALAPRARASVYWSNAIGATIGRANNDGTAFNPAFVGDIAMPCGVASDDAHVYWIDRADRSIGRANLDGSGIHRRLITGVDGCAVATDAAHIYWNTLNGSIGRANLDGTGVNPSFIPGVGASFGVAVDRSHVYWTAFNAIGRANLDGTGVDRNFIAVDPHFDQTCGVAVDAGHVYWANALGTVARANLDGTGRDESFIRAAPARSLTCGVAVDSAHLYWAHSGLDAPDTFNDGIGRANRDGTGVNQTFIPTSETTGIAVDAATQAPPPARVRIGDVRMAEGDAGQRAFQFPVTLDSPQSSPTTVDFATDDAAATAPSDYAAATGTVTFEPGETAKSATVEVNGDGAVEPDEAFNVDLSNAIGNVIIADGQGVGTIVNDDQPTPTPTPSPSPSPSPSGCTATNRSDFRIADLSTVESPLRISGCAGNASATATVQVQIAHTFIGDLVVTLVAPDGSTYVLHNRTGGSTDDIDQTYTVNLSSEPADGTWRLRVRDAAPADVGRIDSWTIAL
jgi:hypothetical protein